MKPFGIIGDSHTGIFVRAVKSASEDELLVGGPIGAANMFFDRFFEPSDNHIVFTHPRAIRNYPIWKNRSASRGIEDFKGRLIVSMGFSGAPFYGSRMWRQFSRTMNEQRFMSSGLFAAIVEALQSNVIKFYQYCIDSQLLVAAIAAPPPQYRHVALPVLGMQQVKDIQAQFQQPVRTFLTQQNVPIIEPDWFDDNAMLRPEFDGADPQHAGLTCGPLVVDAIKKTLM